MKLGRWLVFVKERFDPASHLPTIGLFLAAHFVVRGLEADRLAIAPSDTPLALFLLLLIGTGAFFFKLRLYDEIKDYEVDQTANPTRPLPRGLLSPRDLRAGIVICLAIELIAFAAAGTPALIAMLLAILYSLLMYKEFFLGPWIRPRLTLYAISHTFVIALLSLAIFAAHSGQWLWSLSIPAYGFALSNWCLFNLFEFGRKSFSSREERDGIPSYSKIFGRFGAASLVVAMAALSTLLIQVATAAPGRSLPSLLLTLNVALLLIAAGYVLSDSARWAKCFRGATTLYMALLFAGFLLACARLV